MRARRWAALLCAGLAACQASREPPDLILITVDTLRADRLGAYGYTAARTPTFDALAARGRLFTQATTPLPRTTPALASLFTGLEPHRHGSREVGEPRRSGTTLAEVLRKRGWYTAGVTANGVAGAHERLHDGFTRFVEKEDLESERAVYVTDAALAEVAAAPVDQPLFLWAHYVDPHYTYNPPAAFDPGQTVGGPCRALMQRVKQRQIRKGQVQSDEGGVAGAALDSCSQLYDAEVAFADHEVGRLLEGLRRAGRLANAYVVFTSDHGENLGEARLHYEHGPSLHDASLRIPLVLTGPGVAPGRDADPILLQDLAPTLLALAGVPEDQRPAVDGSDQQDRLQGAAPTPQEERIAFAESGSPLRSDYTRRPWSGAPDGVHCFHDLRWSWCGMPGKTWTLHDRHGRRDRDVADEHPDVVTRFEAARAVWRPGELRERSARTARFKLMEHPQLEGGWRRALYDLEADPAESIDVSAAHPQVAARLGAALDAWLAAAPAPEELQPSEADLEALRSLGYVD